MYERDKKEFDELAANLRYFDSLPEIYQDSKAEWQKRQVEYKILLKSYQILKNQVKMTSKTSTK